MASLMDRLRQYQIDDDLDFNSLPDDLSRLGAGVDPSKIGRMPQKVKSGALLPLSRYDDGSVSFDPSAGILGSAADALSAPYRAYTDGLEDPEAEAMNMAGWLMGGGFGRAVAKPAAGAELGMFGGRLAKTADLDALAKAEAFDAAGTPREAIWDQTGWFKGKDGKWRFEIDDSGARWQGPEKGVINPGNVVDGTVKDFFDHQELFDAYPDSGGISAMMYKQPPDGQAYPFGSYSEGRGVSIRDAGEFSDLGSVMLHEMQHKIQGDEGFSFGSNPSALANDLDPVGTYRRHAGEVEARAVQARKDLTASERRARYPWLDYDVPEADQIVRFGNDGR